MINSVIVLFSSCDGDVRDLLLISFTATLVGVLYLLINGVSEDEDYE